MNALSSSSADAVTPDMKPLRNLIESSEEWLMNRVLDYAKRMNYVKYTSTLAEAWRVSIAGLSRELLKAMESNASPPELCPDEDFTKDPAASFGILEAQKHRARGVPISTFLGLLKYYRRSYLDLVSQAGLDPEKQARYLLFVRRCFDRMELGFASEWCVMSGDEVMAGLQTANPTIMNGKNLYLTIFESIPDPVILFNDQSIPFCLNQAAMPLFGQPSDPGQSYYGRREGQSPALPAWVHALPDHVSTAVQEASFIKVVAGDDGNRSFDVRLKRLLDVSGKFSGVIAILKDVTRRQQAEEALRKSEEAFRAIFENSRDAIMLLDRQGFFDCNRATLELFGCESKEQFVGKHPSELSPSRQPDGRESVAAAREYIEAAFAEGVQFFEWTHKRKDGASFPAEALLSRFDLGERTVLQAVVRDITERKTTEQNLREGRDALQKKHVELSRLFTLVEIAKREWERTMDCVDDMILLIDSSGRIKRCNKAFSQFTSQPYDRILGSDWMAFLAEQGIETTKLLDKNSEVLHKPTDRWFTVNSYPVTGISSDSSAGFVITFHDFTARKEMTRLLEWKNQNIEESRQSLQRALDELSRLIQQVEKEQTFDIRFKNPDLVSCHVVLGCSTWECPCYGKESQRCWQIAGTHCGGKIQGASAQKVDTCNNCEVFKAATSNPIYQIGEHFNNMMHILDLKNRELQTAYSELKLTQAKILQQEKMASIGQLAAGVAHEINNPMGFISSNLGTLGKYLSRVIEYEAVLASAATNLHDVSVDDRLAAERKRLKIDIIVDDAKKLIAESLDGAERVKTIVQNLKSFSRVDQAEAKSADINECIETTLNIVWNELKYKSTLKKEYGELPRTWCYPQQLNQVFMNLLVNAAHAIDKQGVITVTTWADAGSIYASVADTGSGIAPENLTKIFEPFFTTKEVGKGTGLGLSITYDIIKKHNGDITVQSEVGKGTTFTVRIPVNDGRHIPHSGEKP